MGCHAALQGIFPTQGLNPGLPHCRWTLYQLSHQVSPLTICPLTNLQHPPLLGFWQWPPGSPPWDFSFENPPSHFLSPCYRHSHELTLASTIQCRWCCTFWGHHQPRVESILSHPWRGRAELALSDAASPELRTMLGLELWVLSQYLLNKPMSNTPCHLASHLPSLIPRPGWGQGLQGSPQVKRETANLIWSQHTQETVHQLYGCQGRQGFWFWGSSDLWVPGAEGVSITIHLQPTWTPCGSLTMTHEQGSLVQSNPK